ncbi:hypothetical protein [Pseudohalocynthiibacter sp. F2068]|jgi:hypothetical protein|uniref:hypothetical protein n=1 Tax=Pseudohalocynthiibacter sp. F2068 TaxID=2926418 RepID=UPI001FF58BCB|nr:hypothetical protein [Pseudohalocynthiibacter sp. F2068]MCK0104621.1 hypothetical protein [Pseudohalocynthiibacter sp. F2068]
MVLFRQLFIFTLFFCYLSSTESVAAEEECKGDAPQEHRIGKYHFETTSQVYRRSGVHFYVTCVKNNGEGDLWVDWFVPGPQSFVPSGIALESPRTFVTRETQSFVGCLEYGNRAETLNEHFLGHTNDQSAIDEEQSLGCEYWARQATLEPSDKTALEELSYPFRVFFPSDTEKPADSMLVMQGTVSLRISEENRFTSMLEYDISQFDGREGGAADEVVMRPVDGGPAGELLNFVFLSEYKSQLVTDFPSLPMKWEDNIAITASFESDWMLTSTRYGFYDKNNVFVGAIFVPVIAPISQ